MNVNAPDSYFTLLTFFNKTHVSCCIYIHILIIVKLHQYYGLKNPVQHQTNIITVKL